MIAETTGPRMAVAVPWKKPDRYRPERIGYEEVEQRGEEENGARCPEQASSPNISPISTPIGNENRMPGKGRHCGDEAQNGVTGAECLHEEGKHPGSWK